MESSGEKRTVYWEDHPGDASTDDEDVLAAPTPEEVEERQSQLFDDLGKMLREDYGLVWGPRGESGWYDFPGNGYGGESLLATYNSAAWTAEDVPEGPDAWRELLHAVDAVLIEHELGGLVLFHESSLYAEDEAWQGEEFERLGTNDPDQFWEWTAESSNGSQWVSVVLTDASKDPSGEAAESLREIDWPERSVQIDYGVTTVRQGQREEFQRAVQPFDGLAKPAGTHSD
ncbi:hypothetical protein [Nesterenkonia sandarakina]|uniref:Uncharacterized protein n=1 Tax=Nesterenkonia sandarakina TaxID=272918 RepID=A0A7Z0EBQ8_9MICC|nr:hypothetical protein [Nesterenkonia sandarakina]NYJ17972.1 hypothetical protein [Nesterenkonia sandarakina]